MFFPPSSMSKQIYTSGIKPAQQMADFAFTSSRLDILRSRKDTNFGLCVSDKNIKQDVRK